jgi:hypothetical protein
VPHEELQPLVQTICHNFITERNSGEAISAGLNTVRIVASRVPMGEPVHAPTNTHARARAHASCSTADALSKKKRGAENRAEMNSL